MSRPGNAFDGEMGKERPMPYKGRGWDKKEETPNKGVEKKVVLRKKSTAKKK